MFESHSGRGPEGRADDLRRADCPIELSSACDDYPPGIWCVVQRDVGRYRFGAGGDGAEIRVTRKGNALYQGWAGEEPLELLPGKLNAFFAPGFSLDERFVRGARGQVVGIVYTMGDSEVEAKRVP
jgi:hypothetical protein